MLEATLKDSVGSSFFQTPQPPTPIHEHFNRTDQILRQKPTAELWKSYEIDERKKIIRQLKEVNQVTNQQENAINKINHAHNKTYLVCERDRVRMSEFFTNEWINTLITKNPANKNPLPATLNSDPHANLKNLPFMEE
jgi:NH3-dependent NAD+ synthetase